MKLLISFEWSLELSVNKLQLPLKKIQRTVLEKMSSPKKIINVFYKLSTDYYFPNFRSIKILINLRMV